MSAEIPIIQCPIDCIASFGEVFNGQYDHPGVDEVLRLNAVYKPWVLDIGSNVGAFTIWAKDRWPKAQIVSYEPQPEIFEFLNSNVRHIDTRPIKVAIGNPSQGNVLAAGRNRLCSGLSNKSEDGIKVQILPPEQLPPANIVKLDCEGSEAYILEHLKFVPEYLVLEYHSEELRLRCENAMAGKMTLVESTVTQPGLGMLKFLRL